MDEVISIVVSGLGGLVLMAVGWAAVKVSQKLGVELSAARQAQIEHFAKLGIGFAEEHARNWAKEHLIKLDPTVKAEEAIKFVVDRVPDATHAEADAVVHAMLGSARTAATETEAAMGNALRTQGASPARPLQ